MDDDVQQTNIDLIMRQTNYTNEEAKSKLLEYNNNYILVIKNYLGISDKEKNRKNRFSLNQEIYKQLRKKMDSSILDYNKKEQEIKVVLN
jgi:hypothetical protein